MTEQEYQQNVEKIIDAAIKEADKYEYDSKELRYDAAGDFACGIVSEHPWLNSPETCLLILKFSPNRDEYFVNTHHYREAKNFKDAIKEMADLAMTMDVLNHDRFKRENWPGVPAIDDTSDFPR